jgi:thiol-disulfide isomerase/thioredoxin
MLKRGLSLLMFVIVSLIMSCTTPITSEAVQAISSIEDKLTFIDFYSDECPNCMIMVPIVQGLEDRYSDQMTFKFLNIDLDGKALYDSMGLRGNPIFLIVKADHTVVYNGYGRMPELALDRAIRTAIGV